MTEDLAGGDYLTLHGRFPGIGQPADRVVVDIARVKDGVLAEHWDVIQDEATRAESKSGRPMFGDDFPDRCAASGRRRTASWSGSARSRRSVSRAKRSPDT
jgi:hypothetical protein